MRKKFNVESIIGNSKSREKTSERMRKGFPEYRETSGPKLPPRENSSGRPFRRDSYVEFTVPPGRKVSRGTPGIVVLSVEKKKKKKKKKKKRRKKREKKILYLYASTGRKESRPGRYFALIPRPRRAVYS